MRSNEPIFWKAENNYWILTRYADIASQTQNDQLSSNRIGAHSRRMPNEAKEYFRPFFTAVSSCMLMIAPPAHTRLRGPVNNAVTPPVLATMRGRVQDLRTHARAAAQPR